MKRLVSNAFILLFSIGIYAKETIRMQPNGPKEIAVNVKLYLSVRYFDKMDGPFDFTVSIDDKNIMLKRLLPSASSLDEQGTPDYISFPLSEGNHALKITSERAQVNFETKIAIKPSLEVYADFSINRIPKGHPLFKKESAFEFRIQNKDFGWR